LSTANVPKKDERIRKLNVFSRFFSRPESGALAAALLVFIGFTIITWNSATNSSDFLGWRQVMTWLKFSAEIGIIGIGATLLMIGGEFDLSVGSTIGLTSLILLTPIVLYGWAPWQAILLTFVVAILIGWLNGTLINATGLPSFIVTLAFLYFYRGLTLVVTRALTGGATRVDIQALVGKEGIADVPGARDFIRADWLAQLFSGNIWGTPKLMVWLSKIGLVPTDTFQLLDAATGKRVPTQLPIIEGIPVAVGWWIILTILAIVILQRTQLGNWIFGTGGHAESARNVGVPTRRVKIILFILTALCATVFSSLQTFETGSSEVLRGQLKEFEAIIVAVIGGTLLTGGYGSIVGAFWGALTYGMLARGFEIQNLVSNEYFRIALGVGILAAVLFGTYIRKRATEAK
jgi:simple sugar transport system permease protein